MWSSGWREEAVNRTERLYALAEELRAAAPRPVTARQLAARFEVSVRTVERDLSALLQAGVPIWATAGPGGGYAVDATRTLPPLNFSPAEAAALALALARSHGAPYSQAAGTALRKLVRAMSASDAEAARDLVGRIRLVGPVEPRDARVQSVLEEAVRTRRVVAITYGDRAGAATERRVEPHGFLGNDRHWYLVGWCRLRDDVRGFRLDRVASAALTPEVAPPRATMAEGWPGVETRGLPPLA